MSEAIMPLPGAGGKGAREMVVSVLSAEWPLGAKEIYSRLRRSHGFNGTYQAVHKAIAQAVSDGVLVRDGKGYSLSEKWISDMERFGSTLADSYLSKQKYSVDELYKREYGSFKFASPLELARFLIFFIDDTRLNPEKKEGIVWVKRAYPLIGLSKTEMERIYEACSKTSYYHLIKNDTILDRLFGQLLTRAGVKNIKFGINSIDSFDIFINGNYVLEIHWPQNIMKSWVEHALAVKEMKQLDLKHWFDFMHDKCNVINVVAYRNQEVAEQIRRQAMEYFKGGK